MVQSAADEAPSQDQVVLDNLVLMVVHRHRINIFKPIASHYGWLGGVSLKNQHFRVLGLGFLCSPGGQLSGDWQEGSRWR